jgi:hypothetical protein
MDMDEAVAGAVAAIVAALPEPMRETLEQSH